MLNYKFLYFKKMQQIEIKRILIQKNAINRNKIIYSSDKVPEIQFV